jgi:DNA-binding LytR/AlgR family response regulator
MTRALIADDEAPLARGLQKLLTRLWPELEIVAVADNGLAAAAAITALAPDLAFLDIHMPGMSGLEVAQGIVGTTRVVFVTAFDSHAIEAFELGALDYLLKPVTERRLTHTLARLRSALAQPVSADARLATALATLLSTAPAQPDLLRYIRAAQGELTHQIAVDEVLYFQADDKYTRVLTAKGEYLIRSPILDLCRRLDPHQFVQIHRAYLVNLTHVSGTRRDPLSRLFVRLDACAAELPVARAYVHLFKAM